MSDILESFAEYHEYRALVETLCQEMYNDLNDGKPSHVLRYAFLREALEFVKSDPLEDSLVQTLMVNYLTCAILAEKMYLRIETIQVPNED